MTVFNLNPQELSAIAGGQLVHLDEETKQQIGGKIQAFIQANPTFLAQAFPQAAGGIPQNFTLIVKQNGEISVRTPTHPMIHTAARIDATIFQPVMAAVGHSPAPFMHPYATTHAYPMMPQPAPMEIHAPMHSANAAQRSSMMDPTTPGLLARYDQRIDQLEQALERLSQQNRALVAENLNKDNQILDLQIAAQKEKLKPLQEELKTYHFGDYASFEELAAASEASSSPLITLGKRIFCQTRYQELTQQCDKLTKELKALEDRKSGNDKRLRGEPQTMKEATARIRHLEGSIHKLEKQNAELVGLIQELMAAQQQAAQRPAARVAPNTTTTPTTTSTSTSSGTSTPTTRSTGTSTFPPTYG